MRKRRAFIGDVYEVPTAVGLAYLQYTHNDTGLGQLVRVLPGKYSARPQDLDELVAGEELYFIFYLLDHSLKEGLLHFVRNFPIPVRAVPFPLMRQALDISADGRVLGWRIGDGRTATNRETLKALKASRIVTELSPTELKLSDRVLLPHSTLVDYLVTGWTPERAEELRLAARKERDEVQSASSAEKGDSHLEHFLYFPQQEDAEKAAERLRGKSMRVEVSQGDEEEAWLVFARSPLPASEEDIGRVRTEVEALAEELGGEYDGWGLPVLQ